MQIKTIAAIISFAAGSTAFRIKICPNAGSDCGGDGLPSDTMGSGHPVNACFDISDAQSLSWKFISSSATTAGYAKFRYYSETGCNGDVTAVKVLCGDPSNGSCYNKHDPNAGSVNVQLPEFDDTCHFWEDEGEEECSTPDADGMVPHDHCG
jgi:hypothetical protein